MTPPAHSGRHQVRKPIIYWRVIKLKKTWFLSTTGSRIYYVVNLGKKHLYQRKLKTPQQPLEIEGSSPFLSQTCSNTFVSLSLSLGNRQQTRRKCNSTSLPSLSAKEVSSQEMASINLGQKSLAVMFRLQVMMGLPLCKKKKSFQS